MTQTPTDALRLVPRRATPQQLEAAAFNLSAEIGAAEAMKLGPHIERAYELLVAAAPASPLPGGGLEPLENDPAVAALCDSNYRAGALAGWNAANHSDPAEGERIMAHIREVEPGSLAPILERNRLRKLPAAPTGEPK